MKNVFLASLCASMLVLTSCNKDEPEVNPLVQAWVLDEVSLSMLEDGFDQYNSYSEASSLFGENFYNFEFLEDLTYTRELEFNTTDGGTELVEDAGVWEQDSDQIDLDPDNNKLSGLGYVFTITEITDRELFLEQREPTFAYPDDKINEWFGDGTINDQGEFAEGVNVDSIRDNFIQEITAVYTLNFDIK